MYIPFNQLPDTARIWVYAAPRSFSAEELALIEHSAPQFLNDWNTHGTPMQASFQVLENQFLILSVNEAVQAASGCSIDSSMGYIRSLEQQTGLSLSDRSLVYFLINGSVVSYALSQIKESIAKGALNPESLLINTLAATKDELQHNWLVPVSESWLKRYFKKATA